MAKPLAICWAGDASSSQLAEPRGLALLGVRGQSARESDRETARLRIRAVLTAALAAHAGIHADRIALRSPQGVAPWAIVALDAGDQRVALSISHDGGISVAAYSFSGAVGIDVMSISPVPDWRAVARDYLGPGAARKLAARPDGERDAAFAHAWSEHEARLKCLGLQLSEWCDERAVALQACRCFPLALPEGYVGYVALIANTICLRAIESDDGLAWRTCKTSLAPPNPAERLAITFATWSGDLGEPASRCGFFFLAASSRLERLFCVIYDRQGTSCHRFRKLHDPEKERLNESAFPWQSPTAPAPCTATLTTKVL